MNTTNVYIHSVSALSNSKGSLGLHEGSSVSVRVLSQQQDGRYLVSFAGSRFSVASENPLKQGAVFQAKVSLNNGTVVLVPEKNPVSESFVLKQITLESSFTQIQTLSDLQLVNFFSSMGLVPDNLTLRLFQQLQQLGAKLDTKLLQKARLAALKFSGREFEAAEIALLLEEKGIESSSEAIMQFLSDNLSNKDSENRKKHKNQIVKNDSDKEEPDFSPLREVFDSSSDFYNNYQGENLLQLFNHLNNPNIDTHWICLPFDLTVNTNEIGKGRINICFDKLKKSVSKAVIFAKTGGQEYSFVIYFSNSKKSCEKILFHINPEPSIGAKKLEQNLKSLFLSEKDIVVEWSETEITSFYTENIPLSFVEGCV